MFNFPYQTLYPAFHPMPCIPQMCIPFTYAQFTNQLALYSNVHQEKQIKSHFTPIQLKQSVKQQKSQVQVSQDYKYNITEVSQLKKRRYNKIQLITSILQQEQIINNTEQNKKIKKEDFNNQHNEQSIQEQINSSQDLTNIQKVSSNNENQKEIKQDNQNTIKQDIQEEDNNIMKLQDEGSQTIVIENANQNNVQLIPLFQQKKKVFNKKVQEIDQGTKAKFHNMNKLFLNSVLTTVFTKENIQTFQIPEDYKKQIQKIIHIVKLSGRKKQRNMYKTDLFNHSHYNLLFLNLNKKNISQMRQMIKDVQLHRKCFDLDINAKFDADKVNQINKIKDYIYLLTVEYAKNMPLDEDLSTTRNQYLQKALNGIKKLNSGNLVQRF